MGEALAIREKFNVGERVETKIVFGKNAQKNENWITARIVRFNMDDNTWDLEVEEPAKYRVIRADIFFL